MQLLVKLINESIVFILYFVLFFAIIRISFRKGLQCVLFVRVCFTFKVIETEARSLWLVGLFEPVLWLVGLMKPALWLVGLFEAANQDTEQAFVSFSTNVKQTRSKVVELIYFWQSSSLSVETTCPDLALAVALNISIVFLYV